MAVFMGKAVVVTSGKGGTGKTSVTGGVASCLAALGKKVLCLDADVGLRNLDIVLGLSDRALLDFMDVLSGNAELKSAVVGHPVIPRLSLLSAPSGSPDQWPQPEEMKKLVSRLKQQYDYCLIDSPAGLGAGFRLASCAADGAIVVCTPDAASLRDARRAAEALETLRVGAALVVNRVRPKLIARQQAANVDDAMDITGVRLLGLVPEDEAVIICSNRGVPVILQEHGGAARAYLNIAKRLDGQRVPLMKIR